MALSDFDTEGVGLPSTWRRERNPVEVETQTPSFDEVPNEVQTVISLFSKEETTDRDIQTDDKPPGVPEPVQDEGVEGTALFPGTKGADDNDKVAKFLDTVTPGVMKMMEANVHSFAFEGYDVAWDAERTTTDAVHTLTAPMYDDADLEVVSISWNSTGSVIAAAYGRIDLVGWCKGTGYVCCWNITRKEVTKPDVTIMHSSYMTSIAFHPTHPSILLGGSYTGEIMVWDISSDVPLVVSSDLQAEESHRDPVCKVMWLLDRTARPTDINRFVMASASGDGRILFWSRDPKNKVPHFDAPLAGYVLKPRAPALGSSRVDSQDKASIDARDEVGNRIGILGMAVMYSDAGIIGTKKVPATDSRFILGTENGGVYRSSVDIPKIKTQYTLKSLKVGAEAYPYESHYGPVQACSSSPFERNLFLTASSDGTAKLRNVLESTLLTLEPSNSAEDYIYCAEFSPFRPCVIALGMRNSTLVLYDLEASTVKPLTVEAGDGQPVIALAFNHTDNSLIATGDGRGQLKIWQLPNNLTQLSKGEQQLLQTPVSEDRKKKDCWFRMTGLVF